MTVSSPSEDVVTAVSAFAGNSESCDGACTEAIDHVWDTANGKLDLTAVKDPSNFYTVKTFDATTRLPTKIVYGASDSSGSSPQRTIFLAYGDSNFPGLVTSTRRQSDIALGDPKPPWLALEQARHLERELCDLQVQRLARGC